MKTYVSSGSLILFHSHHTVEPTFSSFSSIKCKRELLFVYSMHISTDKLLAECND